MSREILISTITEFFFTFGLKLLYALLALFVGLKLVKWLLVKFWEIARGCRIALLGSFQSFLSMVI